MEDAKALVQQGLMLQQQMQQQQQQQILLQQVHKQQQQAAAISRFPSNIDAHLIPPGGPQQQRPPSLNSVFLQQQQQQKQQLQQKAELQMAYQDAWRVCHPDFKRPFSSLEDACERLLPYHVVADYEAEEDDRILDSDTTGQVLSRSQQWDNNIAAKVAEFTGTFEKQALAFNIISRKRALGEFRSEERLRIEQALLQEEKKAMYELKAEIESREKAGREAQLRIAAAMAQVEQQQARGEGTRGPLRGSAVGFQGSSDHDIGEREQGVVNTSDEMMMNNGWGNNLQRDEKEPSEDFLNDEENDNGDTGGQQEWREVEGFDLNTR